MLHNLTYTFKFSFLMIFIELILELKIPAKLADVSKFFSFNKPFLGTRWRSIHSHLVDLLESDTK